MNEATLDAVSDVNINEDGETVNFWITAGGGETSGTSITATSDPDGSDR